MLPCWELRYPLDLVNDDLSWAWVRAPAQYGQRGKKFWGWALVGRGMLLGRCWKDETLVCVPVVLDRKLAAHHRIQEDWLPGWLGRQRERWVDLYSPLPWPLLQDAKCLWHVTVEWNWLEKLPKPLPLDGCWAMGFCFLDRVSKSGLCFPDGMGAESLCFLDGLLSFGLILAESHTKLGNQLPTVDIHRGFDCQPISQGLIGLFP